MPYATASAVSRLVLAAAICVQASSFAAYHVPIYPSHRAYGLSDSTLVRAAWLPLFDAYDLTAAFENHDHMHKRTKRLRNNVPDPDGTLYLGDGCLGMAPRDGAQAQLLDDPAELERLGLPESYLAAWSSTRHFWLVEVPQGGRSVHFTAVDADGVAFDAYDLTVN